MAESVDALVSNTSGAIHPGSIPGLGTKKVDNRKITNLFSFHIKVTHHNQCSSFEIELL